MVSCVYDNAPDTETVSTYEYCGEFFYSLHNDADGANNSKDALITDINFRLVISSTTENVLNTILINDYYNASTNKKVKNICIKPVVTGTSASFTAAPVINIASLPAATAKDLPTKFTQVYTKASAYGKVEILEGKILKGIATTKGKNKTDSLYIKVKLHVGTIKCTSVIDNIYIKTLGGVQVKDTVYKWSAPEFTDDNKPETYIMSGHRYTGYLEDMYDNY